MITPMGPTATPRLRRTQEERSAATRTALLDATLECLVEYGYANVTTTRVVERAGMSRGAQVHHFPTKARLVTEAVRHLAHRRIAEVLEEMSALPGGRELRVEAALDRLWRAHSGPLFQAAMELWVAARTDAELRSHLVEVEREVNQALAAGTRRIFPEQAGDRGFGEALQTVLAAVRGLAMLRFVDEEASVERRWRATRRRLVRLLRDPGGPVPE
jgi:AcrR family transcriptional regulator